MNGIGEIPETGAIFTLGKSKFADNIPSCFWLKNDKVVCASCGDEHTALLTQAGKVYVFGSNDWGQLGLGHTHAVLKPTCIKSLKLHKCKLLTCGRNHTLVYTEQKDIYSFGNNNDSQLGPFEKSSYNAPVCFNTSGWGEIKELHAGADFSVALTTDGKLYVWGSNGEGQLGIGSDLNEIKEPTLLNFDEIIEHVSCGYYHTAFCTKSGDLYTFGENENFKLGDQSTSTTSTPIKINTNVFVKNVNCGGSHTAFISKEGHVYTFGDGTHGQLGHGTDMLQTAKPTCIERLKQHPIENAYCGENFTVAITTGGKIYTFGNGRHGKLGVGEENFTNQFKPFRCHQFSNYFVYQASCGGCHLIILAMNRRLDDIASSESEIEDPLQTLSKPVKFNPMNTIAGETINHSSTAINLSRSLSAREKRRQVRQTNLLSQTLPPLKSIPKQELLAATKFLSQKSDVKSTTLPIPKPKPRTMDAETLSEISEFNKVHVLTPDKPGELPTFHPVKPPRSKLNKSIVNTDKTETEYAKPTENGVKDQEETNALKSQGKEPEVSQREIKQQTSDEDIQKEDDSMSDDVDEIQHIKETETDKSTSGKQHQVNEGASTSKSTENTAIVSLNDKDDLEESEYETESEPEADGTNISVAKETAVEKPNNPQTSEITPNTNTQEEIAETVKSKKRWFSFGKREKNNKPVNKSSAEAINNGDNTSQLKPSTGPETTEESATNDNTTGEPTPVSNGNTKPRSKLCNIL